MSDKFIQIAKPVIGRREISAVKKVMKSGMLSQGNEVLAFEEEISNALHLNQPVAAVNSGTSALHLGLLASGIGPGDEVIVPSFTFAATVNSIALTGATPVFVDIDFESYNIDANKIEELVTGNTKAVMVVHLYGLPADIDAIKSVTNKHGLLLFEDAAQGHGGSYLGSSVGTFGHFSIFSFYPTKNMTTGEGGIVSSQNSDVIRRVKLLRNQGMEIQYQNEVIGYNARMTDLQAAIGRQQLKHLPGWTEKRIRNAEFFNSFITPEIKKPHVPYGVRHVFHQYTIGIPEDRDRFAQALREEYGVGSGVYYPTPCHKLPSLRHYFNGNPLTSTELASQTALSLPVRPNLRSRELHRIVEAVNSLSKAGS